MANKVLTIQSSSHYNHLDSYGELCTNEDLIFTNPDEIRLVVFPGGADVHPSVYGHQKHRRTYANEQQDKHEIAIFKAAQENGIPCLGICRGSQLLTALSGGFLYQDTTGHTSDHSVMTYDGKTFNVTSSHHQMFGFPLAPGAMLLVWSKERRSRYYDTEVLDVDFPAVEPEAVFYPKTNSLAVQFHPEWMPAGSQGVEYYLHMVDTYLLPIMEKRDDLLNQRRTGKANNFAASYR